MAPTIAAVEELIAVMSKKGPPVRRKQADRRAEAEEKLIAAAIELIAKRGIDGLRLAELGAIAGFSRALPGHYFGHRDELIRVIVRRIIDRYKLNIRQEATDAPGLGHVIALVDAYVKAMAENHSNFVALHAVFGAAPTNDGLLDIVAVLNDEGINEISAAIESGKSRGEVASHINGRHEAVQLLALLRGLGSLHLIDNQLPIHAIGREYLDALQKRLAPAP